MIEKINLDKTSAWPFVEAKKILKDKKIFIEKDNQKIIDNCNWVFLSVTPIVGERIIKNLNS